MTLLDIAWFEPMEVCKSNLDQFGTNSLFLGFVGSYYSRVDSLGSWRTQDIHEFHTIDMYGCFCANYSWRGVVQQFRCTKLCADEYVTIVLFFIISKSVPYVSSLDGFCSLFRSISLSDIDTQWYGMIWYDMIWYDMIHIDETGAYTLFKPLHESLFWLREDLLCFQPARG